MNTLMDVKKVNDNFFAEDARIVAKKLLGRYLVRQYDGRVLIGRIVETESYIGSIDKACHAYGGKKTPKILPLYMQGGVSYIYSIYGMYYCFNTITGEEDDAQGVLIRAVEPVMGIEEMSINRFNKEFSELTSKELLNLTSGPSKLCIALKLDKNLNKHSLLSDELFIGEKENESYDFDIIECKRIGIDYAEEAKDFLWRYYIKGNKFISIKDKIDK